MSILTQYYVAFKDRAEAAYTMYDHDGQAVGWRGHRQGLLTGQNDSSVAELQKAMDRMNARRLMEWRTLKRRAEREKLREAYNPSDADELEAMLDLAMENTVHNTKFAVRDAPFSAPTGPQLLLLPQWMPPSNGWP